MPNFPGFHGVFFLIVLGLGLGLSGTAPRAQTAAPTADAKPVAPPVKPPEADAKPPEADAKPPEADAKPPEAAAPLPPAPKSAPIGPPASMLPHDLSPIGMFMAADVVVKGVMIGLGLASFVTWTILLAKTAELIGTRRRAVAALDAIAGAATLRDAAALMKNPRAPVARLVTAALAEIERSGGLPAEGIKERAATLLSRIEARAGRTMGRGTGLLATIGSTAPFVGLFGTVWGIMNSFIGISKTNTTNLAVVAPGIAEALLATACGLVAAIPAVIIYNLFARGITGYRAMLADASAEVMRLVSRDLDRAGALVSRRQAAE